jgi:hypothetical protein
MNYQRLSMFLVGVLAGTALLLALQGVLEWSANRRGWTGCGDGTYRALDDSPVRLRPHSWFAYLPRLEVRD